jgi:fucose 4-O-acetylase-like acetyltransferase
MGPLRQLAERTPAQRDRYVDLLRALALMLVVLGHWLITVIRYEPDRRLTGHSALEYLPWAYPITWLFQVMPVFFMVGGYANATSLSSRRDRGGDAVGWLQDRAARLVRPTTALLLALAAAALIAQPLGADPGQTRTAVWVASIPLWFLSAYLVVVVLTPIMFACTADSAGPSRWSWSGWSPWATSRGSTDTPNWRTATSCSAGWPSTRSSSSGGTAGCPPHP